jgi:hypothetical protein
LSRAKIPKIGEKLAQARVCCILNRCFGKMFPPVFGQMFATRVSIAMYNNLDNEGFRFLNMQVLSMLSFKDPFIL